MRGHNIIILDHIIIICGNELVCSGHDQTRSLPAVGLYVGEIGELEEHGKL